jgi:hypothetical protein
VVVGPLARLSVVLREGNLLTLPLSSGPADPGWGYGFGSIGAAMRQPTTCGELMRSRPLGAVTVYLGSESQLIGGCDALISLS